MREEPGNTTSRLFLPDKGYGVINLQKIEHSPTAASITSDITLSVIFGGEFTMKSSLRKNFDSKQFDILETTDEAEQELSAIRSATDPSPSQIENHNSPSLEEQYEEDMIEAMNHDKSQDTSLPGDFSKAASRGVSLMSPSTNDSATHQSTASLLMKKAQLLASKTGGKVPGEDEITASSHSKFYLRNSEYKAKSSFLSQFSCGVFAASSFAFCAIIHVLCTIHCQQSPNMLT